MASKSKVVKAVDKGYISPSREEDLLAKQHGGYRGEGEGFGRPAELKDPSKILVTLEGRHLDLLADLETESRGKVKGRSAVIRRILDRIWNRRKSG